jgi:four helix bundle protein
MRSFRTHDLAVACYQQGRALKLPTELREQFRRASSSIALNLAEGTGRASFADRARFFRIAFGSQRECRSILALHGCTDHTLLTLLDQLGASLYRLCQACESR